MDILRAALTGRGRNEESQDDGQPGCLQLFLTRMWGAGVAILVMVVAALNLVFCLKWSIYMMCGAFVMLFLEASFIAGLFDCSEEFSQLLSRVKPWQKFIIYCTTSVPPLFGCFGMTNLIACGAWFASGIAYFYMWMQSSRGQPHSVSYSKVDEEAQVNIVSEGNDGKDSAVPEERSAWWPFPGGKSSSAPAESNQGSSRAASASEPTRQAPEPAMTGSVPDNVPAAFPETNLPESVTGPRTIAYTGPAPKPQAAVAPPPASVPMPAQQSATGPRTIAYSGPLIKPMGAARLA